MKKNILIGGVLFCNNYVMYIALFFKKILNIKS